ncbi:protein Wnt-11b-2 [Parasteatoda tepidariorum]|uniref:protein Wnt-11b-2 n=1 Tax=Parasteatoda tepidariorum TaxID=114398 RepID=UPI00077FC773|nr:protein Wnt-11b-2 [Parasteatoda tepidariorum]
MLCFRIFIIAIVVLTPTTAVHWIALSKWREGWNRTSQCLYAKKNAFLKGRQVSLCQKHVEVMSHIVSAAKEATNVCLAAFSDMRWNCSSIKLAPYLTPDLTKGTREQAFVYSLASASVAHSIARVCSDGSLTTCSCGSMPHEPPHGDFKWGGCAHNVKHGLKFARNFADAPWRQKSVRKNVVATVNRHNNQAGRRAIRSSLQTDCKCHGVSGSCNIKTCWRALPRLSEIGERLKRKYYIATEVKQRQIGSKHKLLPANGKLSMYQKNDLIFVAKSPDYCLRDDRVGSIGTRGRLCNSTSTGTDSCDSMCCGRGYNIFTLETYSRCKCKYYWCCYVKCEVCRTWKQAQECN